MDLAEYKREVEKLEREVSSMDSSPDESINRTSTASKFSGILKYKCYMVVFVCVFLFLLIFKPKIILKIETHKNESQIVVDKKRFFLWWIVAGILVSFIYSVVGKLKKRG